MLNGAEVNELECSGTAQSNLLLYAERTFLMLCLNDLLERCTSTWTLTCLNDLHPMGLKPLVTRFFRHWFSSFNTRFLLTS